MTLDDVSAAAGHPHATHASSFPQAASSILTRRRHLLVLLAILLVPTVVLVWPYTRLDLYDKVIQPSQQELRPTRLPSCRTADLLNDDVVDLYGANAVKLSRGYEGSGTLVQRMLAKARAGEAIRIAVLGGSVSAGHGVTPPLTPTNHMFYRVLDWFQSEFPGADHTLDLAGALPAVTNIYFGTCGMAHIDADAVDLVFIELDVNSLPVTTNDSIAATEALYRSLRTLPSKPAIVSISSLSLMEDVFHRDLSGGWMASLAISQWFDVPLISMRNWLLPQLTLHADQMDQWYNLPDALHMNPRSHLVMGDMIILYLREQLCEVDRATALHHLAPAEATIAQPAQPIDRLIPGAEINNFVLPQTLMYTWAAQPFPTQFCQCAASLRQPLVPVRNEGWALLPDQGRLAWESSVPGSVISLTFSTTVGRAGLWVWQSEKPQFGWAECMISSSDGAETDPFDVWGRHPPGQKPVHYFDWVPIDAQLAPGHHTVTCTNKIAPIPAANDVPTGAVFRIFAIGAS